MSKDNDNDLLGKQESVLDKGIYNLSIPKDMYIENKSLVDNVKDKCNVVFHFTKIIIGTIAIYLFYRFINNSFFNDDSGKDISKELYDRKLQYNLKNMLESLNQ